MAILAEYITKNYPVVRKLLRAGAVSITLQKQYDIYQYYQTTKHIPSKMQRYTVTSEAMKVSERMVRDAVKEMKRVV